VVTGSVQRRADSLRINVQIIEARVERVVWGERYAGVPDDIFDLQDKLTRTVIGALRVQLAPAERVHLASRPTASVAAYDHYRHAQAVAAAERAIEVDPNDADAYALLAWTLNYAGRPRKAQSELERAMRLNPRPPASYLEILSEIHFVRGKYDESASTSQRVLNINPGYVRARLWNAAALARAGAQDAAEWEVGELLTASPDLSLARLELAFPFKNPRELDLVLGALKEAGLPER
jgi:adenylate cyclase